MAANTERDAFGRLPEELRIEIMKLSPDPLSLRNLVHASPAMGRVLDRYPLEIAELVLDVTVPEQTRRLMGAVLKARFSRFPASLSEAQKVAQTDSPAATDEMRLSRLDQAAAAVRSLLATAENVHAWSHACLEHLIRKSMELRPSTLIKKGTACTTTTSNRTGSYEVRVGRINREEFQNAESRKDCLPQHTGPSTWVEEQRIIKSFWRLQFFLELQGAGHKGRLGTNWSRQEVNVLSQSSAGGFYDVSDFEREQILTACDFLGAVTSGTITSVDAVHDNVYNLPTIRWVEGAVSRCSCAEPPSFGYTKFIFYQGPYNLDGMPMSYFFHHAMSTLDGWLDGCPLQLVIPFQCWRKYGFAIWDDKRMADLGMRDPKLKSPLRGYIKYSFRWFSILTEEDLRDLP